MEEHSVEVRLSAERLKAEFGENYEKLLRWETRFKKSDYINRSAYESEVNRVYKNKKSELFSRSRIAEDIKSLEDYLTAPQIGIKRTPQQYYKSKKYKTATIGGETILLKKKVNSDRLLIIVPSDQFYSILCDIHLRTNHDKKQDIHYVPLKYEDLACSSDGIVLQVLEQPDSISGEEDDVAMFVESRKGKKIVQYNGFRYRKVYKCKSGTERWNCSLNKYCGAHFYMNENNEITMTNDVHDHPAPELVDTMDTDQNETAVVITSRKGKEMLLFRQYTYRKQYNKGSRARWVCSTLKNCRGYVFTDENNFITSAFEEHCHDPPKYYLKPGHILGALREPLILETD